MIHLRANLEQAARFSMRVANKQAAEDALRMMDNGNLKTRGQVNRFIEMALEKNRKERNDGR